MSFHLQGIKAMKNAAAKAIDWTEQGLVPDSVIRHGIRRLLGQRLARLETDDCEHLANSKSAFLQEMDESAIAPLPHKANEQHYELPPRFFQIVLGERLKYSGCYWPEGRLFVHIFTHLEFAYPFAMEGDGNWMGRYFFTGGMMPSHELLDRLDSPFEVERRWRVSGQHYARTSEHWLQNLDRARGEVLELFREVYGAERAETWFQRWRVFFLACAELFGYDRGQEWWVSHYLFERPANRT